MRSVAVSLWHRSWGDRVSGRQWWVLGACVLVAVACYFFLGAHLIAKTNLDRRSGDQQAAIDLARESRGDLWPMRTNAVSNNLWAWVSTLVWDDEDAAFYRRGRWLNLALGGAALACGGMVLGRFLPLVPSVALMLLAGVGVLLPRAVFFQPEPLFFLLFCACWLVGWRLLERNPLWLYAVFGALFALAYLAKPSAVPLLIVWVCAGFYRLVVAWLEWLPATHPARRFCARARIVSRGGTAPAAADRRGGAACRCSGEWCGWRHLGGMLLAAAVAGLVLAPRAAYGIERYGSPFFSVTGYWMWQDDYSAESVPFLVRNAHRDRIAALPREEVPSAGRYLRVHGPGRAWHRLVDGTAAKLGQWLFPAGGRPGKPWRMLLPERGIYLLALVGLYVALGIGALARGLPGVGGAGAGAGVLYFVGATAFYILLYGWYDPIGRGDRFLMSLYLPVVLGLALGCERLRRAHRAPASEWACVAVYVWMLCGLCARVVGLVMRPEFHPSCG